MTDKDIVKAAECCLDNSFCSSDCPLIREYTSKGKGVTTCLNAFCNYIIGKYSEEENKQPDKNISNLQTITDNLITAAKMVKQKTKRETPMQVHANNTTGKVLYSCPNCNARITVSSQTAYCDCCGQKLSFGGE